MVERSIGRYARYPASALLVTLLVLLIGAGAHASPDVRTHQTPLLAAGLIGGHPSAGPAIAIPPDEAIGASYLPSSNVLRLRGGELRYLPPGAARAVTVPPDDPGAAAAASETRKWLAQGTVPGGDGA